MFPVKIRISPEKKTRGEPYSKIPSLGRFKQALLVVVLDGRLKRANNNGRHSGTARHGASGFPLRVSRIRGQFARSFLEKTSRPVSANSDVIWFSGGKRNFFFFFVLAIKRRRVVLRRIRARGPWLTATWRRNKPRRVRLYIRIKSKTRYGPRLAHNVPTSNDNNINAIIRRRRRRIKRGTRVVL